MSNDWWLHELKQVRAYYLWLEDGCPNENALDYWLRAEHEINEQYKKEIEENKNEQRF